MENEADVDQRVLHYELDLPNMRIHDLHHQLMMTYFMRIFHIFLLRFHSSQIRGLCLIKLPRATFHCTVLMVFWLA